ncbi:MAG: BamA/TamA family outer membrane protein [Gemmatimonadetes bacterium]|nr:BamA/TamA family outer membrane protein [Gemmatimonadota bacterium]
MTVRAVGIAMAWALGAPRAAGAQDATACEPSSDRVRKVTFSGNNTIADDELASRIVTTPMSWVARLPLLSFLASDRCLDPRQFAGDVLRLQFFYRTHGFPQATVDTAVTRDGRNVTIRFLIAEGTPMRVDALTVSGVSGIPGGGALLDELPVRRGGVFDESAINAARDSLLRRLRNLGYPRADVLRNYEVTHATHSARVELAVVPGPRTHVGEVAVEVEADKRGAARTSAEDVRRIFGVSPGDLYVERDLVAGQRRLYGTETFRQVRVELDSTSGARSDSLARLVVHATEAERYAATLGVGWGTIDCFRAQGTLTDYNFLGGARRVDLTGRVSRIGVGAPTNWKGANTLCSPDAYADQYGDTLNYYVGVSFRQPVLFGLRTVPVVTLYSETRSEYNAYRRVTPIGVNFSVSPLSLWGVPLSVGYSLEFGRTQASPAFFCVVQQLCQAADIANAQREQRVAVLSVTAARDWSNNPVNPSRGASARIEYRHASPTLGSDASIRFNKVVTDFSAFVRVGESGVLAGRFRAGAIFDTQGFNLGSAGQFVPIQERLFAGGPTTVRGFRPNELGPAVYRALSYQTVVNGPDTTFQAFPSSNGAIVVPVGGNTMAVANLEYRVRSPVFGRLLQLSAFTDVGNVWNRSGSTLGFDASQLRWTPGVGLRVLTAFGAFRFDLGYNPYQRDAGTAYYDNPITDPNPNKRGVLYCVSPGNTIPAGTPVGSLPCPSSYRPLPPGDFWSRLTPSISIGQAF